MDEKKVCKYCKSEIPEGAKICPHCRKKQNGKLKWILIAVVVFCIFGAMAGGSDEGNSSGSNSGTKESEKKVEYTVCTVNEMISALEGNAASASDKYKDKYLEVTGRLNVIDSSGDYISIYPDDEFALTGVQCFVQNDEQLNIVKQLNKGDQVTVRGKCTNVGEVLGYSLDIDSIN